VTQHVISVTKCRSPMMMKFYAKKNVTVLRDFLRSFWIKFGHVALWSNCWIVGLCLTLIFAARWFHVFCVVWQQQILCLLYIMRFNFYCYEINKINKVLRIYATLYHASIIYKQNASKKYLNRWRSNIENKCGLLFSWTWCSSFGVTPG